MTWSWSATGQRPARQRWSIWPSGRRGGQRRGDGQPSLRQGTMPSVRAYRLALLVPAHALGRLVRVVVPGREVAGLRHLQQVLVVPVEPRILCRGKQGRAGAPQGARQSLGSRHTRALSAPAVQDPVACWAASWSLGQSSGVCACWPGKHTWIPAPGVGGASAWWIQSPRPAGSLRSALCCAVTCAAAHPGTKSGGSNPACPLPTLLHVTHRLHKPEMLVIPLGADVAVRVQHALLVREPLHMGQSVRQLCAPAVQRPDMEHTLRTHFSALNPHKHAEQSSWNTVMRHRHVTRQPCLHTAQAAASPLPARLTS